MRNLKEYPVNQREINDLLAKLQKEFSYEKTKLIGDMRPVILDVVYQIVCASFDMMEEIDARLDEQKPPLKYTVPWEQATCMLRAMKGEKVYS